MINSINVTFCGMDIEASIEELKEFQKELNELFPLEKAVAPYPTGPIPRQPFAPFFPTPPYDTSPGWDTWGAGIETKPYPDFNTNNITLKQEINPDDHPDLFDERGNMKLGDTIDSSKVGLHPNHPDYKESQ